MSTLADAPSESAARRHFLGELEGQGVVIRVNPDIARALKEEESAVLRDLQAMIGRAVTIKPDAHLHHEQFDVMAI